MNKVFSFLAGGLCGALVGSVTVLLLTPASGEQLRADANARWEAAVQAANQAMAAKRLEKEVEFERMRQGLVR
jgi:gas vesicle protein